MAAMVQGDELFSVGEFTAEQDHSINLQGFKIPAELRSLPPLNLSLRKTPSFLNLLKTKLSMGTDRALNSTSSKSVSEKLKASNFPAAFIKIGSWQQVSRNEADLVAKCYFSKKKLVWEVLSDGLKSKIEVHWSNISAIRASFAENQPGILEIELDQAPAFYQESNPQPKKHTIWNVTTDFTGGQASMHRRHYVRFPAGTLDRHYEKLLESDRRLLELSRKGFPLHESRYFDWAPYEDNSYYYCFSNNRVDTSPDTHRAPKHIQTSQWTFQPPLLVEDSSTNSPMSGSSMDDTYSSSVFPLNNNDSGMEIRGHANNHATTLNGLEEAEMLNAYAADTEYLYGMRFDVVEKESALHSSLIGLSSGDQVVMDSILSSHQADYIDTITSCTEQWFVSISDEQSNCHQLCLLSSRICDENGDEEQFGFDKAFFEDEFMEEDSLGMNNWY